MHKLIGIRYCSLCIIALFSLTSSAQNNYFTIVGTLSEDVQVNIYLYLNGDTLKTKSINRQFIFKGHINEPVLVTLTTDRACGSTFYIDASSMILTTSISKSQKGICVFVKEVAGSTTASIYQAYIKELNEIYRKHGDQNTEQERLKELATRTIRENPGCVLSAHIIQSLSKQLGNDWVKEGFSMLSEKLKCSPDGLDIQKTINRYELIQVGAVLPEFVQNDINGLPFSLTELKGKIVLIDFWASWCVPCRKESSVIKDLYKQHKLKGFEVIGISLDTDKEKWKAAIAQDGLSWIQLSDLKADNEVAKKFQISAIPFNILIDKNGEIIATELKVMALEKTLRKLFN
jgi:thiol-disulfide isomerase/thioredoxin